MTCIPSTTSKPITAKDYFSDMAAVLFDPVTMARASKVKLEITTHCTGSCPESNPTSCPKDLVSEPVVDIEGVPKSFKKHLTPQEWADLKLTLNPPAGVPINLSRNVSDYVIEFLEKYPDLEKEIQAKLDDLNKKAENAAMTKAVATNYCACPTNADDITGAALARRKRMENFTSEHEEENTRSKFY